MIRAFVPFITFLLLTFFSIIRHIYVLLSETTIRKQITQLDDTFPVQQSGCWLGNNRLKYSHVNRSNPRPEINILSEKYKTGLTLTLKLLDICIFSWQQCVSEFQISTLFYSSTAPKSFQVRLSNRKQSWQSRAHQFPQSYIRLYRVEWFWWDHCTSQQLIGSIQRAQRFKANNYTVLMFYSKCSETVICLRGVLLYVKCVLVQLKIKGSILHIKQHQSKDVLLRGLEHYSEEPCSTTEGDLMKK